MAHIYNSQAAHAYRTIHFFYISHRKRTVFRFVYYNCFIITFEIDTVVENVDKNTVFFLCKLKTKYLHRAILAKEKERNKSKNREI